MNPRRESPKERRLKAGTPQEEKLGEESPK